MSMCKPACDNNVPSYEIKGCMRKRSIPLVAKTTFTSRVMTPSLCALRCGRLGHAGFSLGLGFECSCTQSRAAPLHIRCEDGCKV